MKADLKALAPPPRVEALRGKVVGPGTTLHGPGIISQALAMLHKHLPKQASEIIQKPKSGTPCT